VEVLLILGSPVVGKKCPYQRRRMAVLERMLQSLRDDHVCEPNERITVCQRLDSRIPVNLRASCQVAIGDYWLVVWNTLMLTDGPSQSACICSSHIRYSLTVGRPIVKPHVLTKKYKNRNENAWEAEAITDVTQWEFEIEMHSCYIWPSRPCMTTGITVLRLMGYKFL